MNKEMNTFDVVVIGSGLAGYTLCKELRKLDQSQSILVISQDDGHQYSKPMLSAGFGKNKTAEQLSQADAETVAEQLNITVMPYCQVQSIVTDSTKLKTTKGEFHYQKLVLATGASCNKLSFKGADLPQVHSINNLMDYRRFRQAAEDKKRILIIGAGLIGCEFANDMTTADYKVTVVDPMTTALPGLLPEQAGKAVVENLEMAGVTFELNTQVTEITETQTGLLVKLSNGKPIESDLVISAVGLKPNIELALAAGIECERGIIANNNLETSIINVYALGDCAQINGQLMPYILPLMASARSLAKTLTGQTTEVTFGAMPIVIKTPSYPITVLPSVVKDGTWHFEETEDGLKGLYKKDEKLHGFVLTGSSTKEKQTLAKQVEV